MMTPQEVSEHAFSKASFGGYNMAMVDEFLDLLTADYTTLYKENAVLKSKMKVLVDKVEEYRSTEDAMRKALLTAQKMADELVAEAESQRDALLAGAEQEARAKIAALQQDVDNERSRLAAAKQATADYVEKLKGLYQHEMEYLGSLSKLTAPAPKADPVASAVQDIEESVSKIVAQAIPEQEDEDTVDLGPAKTAAVEVPVQEKDGGLYAELLELNLKKKESGERHTRPVRRPLEEEAPAEAEEEDMDASPTRRIDFSNLQFGKDYEIK